MKLIYYKMLYNFNLKQCNQRAYIVEQKKNV